MIMTISDRVRYDSGFDLVEVFPFDPLNYQFHGDRAFSGMKDSYPFESYSRRAAAIIRSKPVRLMPPSQRIEINGRWFNVLSMSELVRTRSDDDGYYRAIYIQINFDTGEYYVGKVNRPTWTQLLRYQGSGLKFRHKFNKHKDQFKRFYISACKSAVETEMVEASIVNDDLIADDHCLNLVAGGGGTSERPDRAASRAKKREYMKRHPEQFKSMLEASKKAFQSGDSAELRARNSRIKQTMGADRFREMSSARIKNWKRKYPKAYEQSRKKNAEAIRSNESQRKRKDSLERWKEENPKSYRAWQEKSSESRQSDEAKAKRKISLQRYRLSNPAQYKQQREKAGAAAGAKLSKAVCMLDLKTGQVIKSFNSQREAAMYLVDNGIAKSMKCVSSISAVCRKSPCTTGYGFRKKAYGYGWCFESEIDSIPQPITGDLFD